MPNFSIPMFITIAIAAFLAVVSFWAAFGPNHMLNNVNDFGANNKNWGEGAFWRTMYAMVGFGCVGTILGEFSGKWSLSRRAQTMAAGKNKIYYP